jgi:hypothetical protein
MKDVADYPVPTECDDANMNCTATAELYSPHSLH